MCVYSLICSDLYVYKKQKCYEYVKNLYYCAAVSSERKSLDSGEFI